MAGEGVFPKVDGDVLYDTDVNQIDPIISNFMELVNQITVDGTISLTKSNLHDFFTESFLDRTQLTIGSQSNVFVDDTATTGSGAGNRVYLDYDWSDPDLDCDFTGGSLDVNWSAAVGRDDSGGNPDPTVTFDAANDEEDLFSGEGTGSRSFVYFKCGTNHLNHGFQFAVRNLNANAGVEVRWGQEGTKHVDVDYSGGTYSITFNSEVFDCAGAVAYVRLAYYDGTLVCWGSDDGSSWTFISSKNVSLTSDTWSIEVGTTDATQKSCSVFEAKTCPYFNSSGYYISDSNTTTGNVRGIFMDANIVSGGAGSGVTYEVTADGSNWVSATAKDIAVITDTGTAVQVKATLTRSTAKTGTPELTYVGMQYTL